jgi:hypothetical protein
VIALSGSAFGSLITMILGITNFLPVAGPLGTTGRPIKASMAI